MELGGVGAHGPLALTHVERDNRRETDLAPILSQLLVAPAVLGRQASHTCAKSSSAQVESGI